MTQDLHGSLVLVTGGSRGIGLEVSRELARRGARVAIAARDRGAIEAAIGKLPGGEHLAVELDVSDTAGWPGALQTIDSSGALRGLVTAAGVLGPIGTLEDVDPAEVERAISINLLGTVFALHYALPRLRAARGRAVTFSGGGATSALPRYDAYAASKAAVVRLTENVAAAGDVEVNCVAPGFVATGIHEGTLEAGPDAAGREYYERTREGLVGGSTPAREPAELVCFLLSREAAGISGRLLSARWDPWRERAFQDRLRREPELGTLRRIDAQKFGPLT